MTFITICLYFADDWAALWDGAVRHQVAGQFSALPQGCALQSQAYHQGCLRILSVWTPLDALATLQVGWDAGRSRLSGEGDVKCLVSKCFLIIPSGCCFLPCRP